MREHEVNYGDDHPPVEKDIPFSSRVAILAEAHSRKAEVIGLEGASEFFEWNSYIIPLCSDVVSGEREFTDEDQFEMAIEAWIDFTHLLDIDHHYPYKTLDECLAVPE